MFDIKGFCDRCDMYVFTFFTFQWQFWNHCQQWIVAVKTGLVVDKHGKKCKVRSCVSIYLG